jgi:hypothetical protein
MLLNAALRMHELFLSDINEAHGSETSSKMLMIASLNDIKACGWPK